MNKPKKLVKGGLRIEDLPYQLFAPDDSGLPWKPPHLWTPKEIQDLVIESLGVDCMAARGYQILLKLWAPSRTTELGLERSDYTLKNQAVEACVGQVLRMGRDAFSDPARFPSGPTATYGEWMIFRINQRQIHQINSHKVAYVNDDRLLGPTNDPAAVLSGMRIETDWAGQ